MTKDAHMRTVEMPANPSQKRSRSAGSRNMLSASSVTEVMEPARKDTHAPAQDKTMRNILGYL